MTKYLLMIGVCLGSVIAAAGCAGTRSASPQPLPQVVRPAQAAQELDTASEPGEATTQEPGRDAMPGEVTRPDVAGAGPTPAVQTGGSVPAGAFDEPVEGAYGQTLHGVATSVLEDVNRPADDAAGVLEDVNRPADDAAGALEDVNRPADGAAGQDAVNEPTAAEAQSAAAGGQEPVEPYEAAAAERDDDRPEESDTRQAAASVLKGYAELLQGHVRADGSVDYASLHRRRLELKEMLMALGELDPNAYAAWPSDEKLAFWINAYNLKLLEIIARNYPIQSSWWLRLTWPPSDIRHVAGIWTDYKCIVMGEEFTLVEVERRFFHRAFNEPRAYVAIGYACRSGPPLRRQPYRGDGLDRQIDEQVKAFVASGHGVRIDRQTMVVHLSAIFKPTWRGKEFVARYGTDKKFKARDAETRAVLNFITGYLSREDTYFLETENYTIEYINFDWRLNDTSRGY